MVISKKEKFFRGLCCNLILIIILGFCVLGCYFNAKRTVVVTSNGEYNGTIFAGDKNSQNVSLMVNVYWGNEFLEQILDIFEKNNIKTTFFVGGTWVKENPELLQKIYKNGHEIGNHGTNHKEHGRLSYKDNLTEIQTCHEFVKHSVGVSMELFAPPGGSYSKSTVSAAKFLGYNTIMWTRDTIDWRDQDARLIFERATTKLEGGNLILMHPTKASVEALPNIISYIKNKGLNITTVSETLGL